MSKNSDPLLRFKTFGLTSVAEVIRTVDVTLSERPYRLEVTKSVSNTNAPFDVRCYRREKLEAGVEASFAYVYHSDFSCSAERDAHAALTWALTALQDRYGAADQSNATNAMAKPKPRPLTGNGFETRLKRVSRKKP